MKKLLFFTFSLFAFSLPNLLKAQYSVARIWDEAQLNAIRIDAARPPVQARNLFHVALAMYDAWAAYDSVASTYLLGKTINGVTYSFTGVPVPADLDGARNEAISYAAYRVLYNRYSLSPNWSITQSELNSIFSSLGYDNSITGTNYASGDPAQLGNYIAQQVISMGYNDGANQINNYAGTGYTPNNPPLFLFNSGNSTMVNVNSWQPLTFVTCVDQNGIPCGSSTPNFVCPRWGKVVPFSMPMSSAKHNFRSGQDYPIYFDPGTPPTLSLTNASDSSSLLFKWGHEMVATWSSHLDPSDPTMWDISPKGKGNIQSYPTTPSQWMTFYNTTNGGNFGTGYTVNPVTGMPYIPQLVKRGDYTRVVSQFWADGPNSETPPGHWHVFLNTVSDYPGFVKKIGGVGPVVSDLEWDVKSYFSLGAAMHDAAIACWGLKGWYDTPRPISMIRKMAALGQCSNPALPHYHAGGLPLLTGYVELVTLGDPASLRGPGNINVNKIKLKAWKGFSYIAYSGSTPLNAAGVGWILADDWMPYQRETFVTPPFAGYVSGHSTYSRAGALCLTNLTGSPYFPGGLAEFTVDAYSNYLGFEEGPSTEVKLQWASYKDASDEASLSRIWGGIHPPFDDMPARLMGEQIGNEVYSKAKAYWENQVMTVEISKNLSNPVCVGSYITFSAAASNAPENAIYQWRKNGTIVYSSSESTYQTNNITDGDIFVCEVTGNGYKIGSLPDTVHTQVCPASALNLKLMIQGFYNGSGLMKNVLENQGVGNNSTLTDSVEVELHKASYPYEMIAKQACALYTDCHINASFTCEASSYYVVIKHRNALETWSSVPVPIGTSTVYDFSASASNAYGGNMIEVDNNIWALYSGELNNDQNIDLLDYSILDADISSFLYGHSASDINGDGNVDLLDFPIVEGNVSNFIFSNHP